MKKSTWIIIAVVAVIVLWAISGYNGMVSQEETVDTAWSQVENQYQRRADLIPNLVNVVKGYAKHEQSTLEGVIEARSKLHLFRLMSTMQSHLHSISRHRENSLRLLADLWP